MARIIAKKVSKNALGRKVVLKAAKTSSADDTELNQRIRERAYALYVERGCVQGHDREDWLRAESECRKAVR